MELQQDEFHPVLGGNKDSELELYWKCILHVSFSHPPFPAVTPIPIGFNLVVKLLRFSQAKTECPRISRKVKGWDKENIDRVESWQLPTRVHGFDHSLTRHIYIHIHRSQLYKDGVGEWSFQKTCCCWRINCSLPKGSWEHIVPSPPSMPAASSRCSTIISLFSHQ